MKRRIGRKILIGLGVAVALFITGVLLFPRILTGYLISRTEFEGSRGMRNIREFRNDTTGRSIIIVGMAHVGKPEFYENVKNLVDSLKNEGYYIYYEGVGRYRTMDSLTLDTLNRKFRKVVGAHIQTSHMDADNKSMRRYNPKKYVAQDYEYLGLSKEDTCWVHADYTLPNLIAKYEEDRGEIILTEYDWQTPLKEKYHRRKSGDTVSYSKYYLVNILRDENLERILTESPHEKILVLYGLSHIYHINLNQLKDSLNLTDSWDIESGTKEGEAPKKQKRDGKASRRAGKDKSTDTAADHREIYGSVLALPEGGRWMTCDGRDTLPTLPSGIPRIVVYYNAEGCVSCRLKELGLWNSALRRLEKSADSLGMEFTPVFILEADPNDPETARTLARQALRHPVLFDTDGEFRTNNTLPADELYHTFLTDSSGRVCLAGSPIFNPALLDAYRETLARLAPR